MTRGVIFKQMNKIHPQNEQNLISKTDKLERRGIKYK